MNTFTRSERALIVLGIACSLLMFGALVAGIIQMHR